MMDHVSTLKSLRKELVEAQQALTSAQQRVDRLLPLIRAYEEYIKGAGGATEPAESVKTPQSATALPVQYHEAAAVILRSASEPLSVPELLERFRLGGRPIQTSKPYKSLHKVLSTHDELFENTGGKWRVKTAA